MIARARVLIAMARPAVVILLGLFAATGLGAAGQGEDRVLFAKVLVIVVGYLLVSVVVNDLADEAIDRVNLPNHPSRPLVAGSSTRREFVLIAVAATGVTLATSALLNWQAFAVVAAGLVLSVSYSLRPIRLADRGAVASLLLPAGYVAVPYLVGIFAARGSVRALDLVLLGGLYVGFIGRILLKDFRDMRGDALFGKRTFLIRHGRRWTCAISASCWMVGSAALVGVDRLTVPVVLAYAGYAAIALGLLRALSTEGAARRDETLISAIAIVGRGMIVTLVGHFSMVDAHWSAPTYAGVIATLFAISAGQVATMVRCGPRTRLTVPRDWLTATPAPSAHVEPEPIDEALLARR